MGFETQTHRAGAVACAHAAAACRARGRGRAGRVRAVGDPDGGGNRRGLVRKKRARAPCARERDEDHDAPARDGGAGERAHRLGRYRHRQRRRRSQGRQPDLSGRKRAAPAGGDAQGGRRLICQRLRHGAGGAHRRQRERLRADDERARGGAWHDRHTLCQLHGSGRRAGCGGAPDHRL